MTTTQATARLGCLLGGLFLLAGPAWAGGAAGLKMDDGYTFFTLKNKAESKRGKRVSKGWTLHAQLRMVGAAPRRSAFRLVVKKGRRKLGETRCEGAVYVHSRVMSAFPTSISSTNCHDRRAFIKARGKLKVEVHFINGADGSSQLVRTYKIVVRKVGRVRGSPRRPVKDADRYYISRHGDAACSLIYRKKARLKPYVAAGKYSRANYYGENTVEMVWSISPSVAGRGLSGGYLRCKVNNKPLPLTIDAVKVFRPNHRAYQVVHTHRRGRKYRKGPPYKDEIQFRQYYVQLPFTFGPKNTRTFRKGYVSLDDHPGKWECKWLLNGKPIRSWRFTVAAGGAIAPHPEEGATLGFLPGAHLVETTIPRGGSFVDKRLVPKEVRRNGCFYGHGWKTPAGKKMAKKVPRKGKAKP